jgi:hypothetical protein
MKPGSISREPVHAAPARLRGGKKLSPQGMDGFISPVDSKDLSAGS